VTISVAREKQEEPGKGEKEPGKPRIDDRLAK
jgi:hypothetical protein